MENFNILNDHPIWPYFLEICEIPRPSGKEEVIIGYLIEFAKSHKLEYKLDEVGNLLIFKPATVGMEKMKKVVLQSHVDMVCEKNIGTIHNFETDPIEPRKDGEWIKAKGTTLGADDAIGVAAQLQILASTDIEHGPIECLFTIDEESGMTGAKEIQKGFMEGEILLNLDSEDEGELFIGCAGGVDTVANYNFEPAETPKSTIAYKVLVDGLVGGHSGDEIHKGLGNSIKILNRFLWEASIKYDIRVHCLSGGNLRNAIPREAWSVFVITKDRAAELKKFHSEFYKIIGKEYAITEPNLGFSIEEFSRPDYILDKNFQDGLLDSLYTCPHGALSMSQEIPGLVETSTNLASIKFNDKSIEITTSQRSSVESAKIDVSQMVECSFKLSGASVEHTGSYPGWTPNTNSTICEISASAYKRLFKTEPKVKAIHAGLECGLFLEKYPKLDMISFGPTIRGAHSPDEKLNIESTYKFWDLLVEILRNIPNKN